MTKEQLLNEAKRALHYRFVGDQITDETLNLMRQYLKEFSVKFDLSKFGELKVDLINNEILVSYV